VIALLAAAGLVIIVGTAIRTAASYGDLPDRVPIHFGITGKADSYGPRPVIWLLVGVQVMVAIIYAAVFSMGAPHGSLVAADALLALFGWVQLQIIDAAISGTNRIPPGRMWLSIAGLIALTLAASRL
jgi:hypothetical protein